MEASYTTSVDNTEQIATVIVRAPVDVTCAKANNTNWSRISLGFENGAVFVGDTDKVSTNQPGHSMAVTGIDFLDEYDLIISCSLDRTVKIWDTESDKLQHLVQTYSNHDYPVWDISTNPLEAACFATGTLDGCVYVWDIHRQYPVRKMCGHLGAAKKVLFHHGGRYVGSSGDDGHVRLWDIRIGGSVRLWSSKGGSCAIDNLTFNQNGSHLFWGSDSGFLESVSLESSSIVSVQIDEPIVKLVGSLRNKVVAGTVRGNIFKIDMEKPTCIDLVKQCSRIVNMQKRSEIGGQLLLITKS